MSTRATVHFVSEKGGRPSAIVYRHSDGYPEGLGSDLKKFLNYVKKNLKDTRFSDPSYLAAKWIVWDAAEYVKSSSSYTNKEKDFLDFLSIGIVSKDPGDIEYRYTVVCDHGGSIPEIIVENILEEF